MSLTRQGEKEDDNDAFLDKESSDGSDTGDGHSDQNDNDSHDDSETDNNNDKKDRATLPLEDQATIQILDQESEDDEKLASSKANPQLVPTKHKKVHQLSLTQTEDFNVALKRRGVVYMARIPPRMTPTKIKRLLQDQLVLDIAPSNNNNKKKRPQSNKPIVTRIYLVPEDASVRKRRRMEHGKNGSKRYVEGWIEFSSKRVAKQVAQALNNTAISHAKGRHVLQSDDLWNLKYLHRFSWSHLTEKVAYERRVQEQKLRLETMQARKETAAYKQLVETGQKLDKIQQRKDRKRQRQEAQEASTSVEATKGAPRAQPPKPNKTIQPQRQPRSDGTDQAIHTSVLQSLI